MDISSQRGPSGISSETCISCCIYQWSADKATGDSMLYVVADYMKLFRSKLDVSDVEILQQDIDNMDEWSREWLMDFHPLKCKVLKMGRTIADLHDILALIHSGSTN